MKIHEVAQGSDEWARLRRTKFTASEASAMMGASPKVKRTELLHMKATGSEREFSDWVQRNLLDKGHEIEAAARPIAEEIIGEVLYPVTGESDMDGRLLASMDGLTMLGNVGWECKSWNEAKADEVRAGRVPEEDYWQVVQQLMVSNAERWLYMVTDGTRDNTVHAWVEPELDAEIRLVAGWDQFERDLAIFAPEAPKVEAVGTAPESLPALLVEVTGMVKASNMDQYKQYAMSIISGINTNLNDDQDFADAEKAVKWCSTVEERLALVKEQILGQTADIDAIFRAIDEIAGSARERRLQLDKLVKARKQAIRDEIVTGANKAFEAHMAEIEKGFGGKIRMPSVSIDIPGAIKGKKTIASLRDAADTELARAKVDATLLAGKITANLATLRELSAGVEFLFADAQQLVQKENEDLRAVIAQRIAEHKKQEEARIEADRERIRQEEQRKLENAERERIQQQMREQEASEGAPLEVTHPAEAKQAELGIDLTSGPDVTASVAAAVTGYSVEVIDIQQLALAVGQGVAPASVLLVNQAELERLVAEQDGRFALPGCVIKGGA